MPDKIITLDNLGKFKEALDAQTNNKLAQKANVGDSYTKAEEDALLGGKVDKDGEKGLSTEDFTTAEKTKLSNIESGAQVNPTNVSAFTNDIGYLTSVAWADVQGRPTFATVATTGSYNDLTNLPEIPGKNVIYLNGGMRPPYTTGGTLTTEQNALVKDDARGVVINYSVGGVGTIYEYSYASGSNRYYQSSSYILTGVKVSHSIITINTTNGTWQKTDYELSISNKQDTLVSGTNIKTINGQSVLGSGDMSVGGVEVVTLTNISGTISDADLLARMFANPQNFVINRSNLIYVANGQNSQSFIRYVYTSQSGGDCYIQTIEIQANGQWNLVSVSFSPSSLQTKLTTTSVADGTLNTVIGFDSSGNVKKSTMPDVSGKQDVIDSNNKLSADLVDDTSTTNKFVTASDKSAWSEKQNALTFNPTVPSGTTPTPLMGIKDGDNYYSLEGGSEPIAESNLAPYYDSTKTYMVEDIVIYGGLLYKCINTIPTPEAWDATHWKRTSIAEELAELRALLPQREIYVQKLGGMIS